MADHYIITLQDTQPFPCPTVYTLLVRHMAYGGVVSLDDIFLAFKVVSPFSYHPNYTQQLLFISIIPCFSWVEVPAIECHWLKALSKSCSNIAPTDTKLALLITTTIRSKSGLFKIGVITELLLSSQKSRSSASPYCHRIPFFVKFVKGLAFELKFRMNHL